MDSRALGVGRFPGAHRQHGEGLKGGEEHAFTDAFENEAGEDDEVVGGALGVADGAAQAVFAEEDVAVGEEEPRGCGLTRGERHGVGFAHPAGGQFLDMEDADRFALCAAFGGDAVHDFACVVSGAVVDGEDLDGDSLLSE